MNNDELKQAWIDAYSDALNRYKSDLGTNCVKDCKKCALATKISGSDAPLIMCKECPESIFSPSKFMGCCNRKTPSMHSLSATIVEKKRLIMYHESAIQFLEQMPVFDFNIFSQFLRKIDIEIYTTIIG